MFPVLVFVFMKCIVVPLIARSCSTISLPASLSQPSPVRVTEGCTPRLLQIRHVIGM